MPAGIGALPERGPFRWKLRATGRDRARLLVHRALMAPPNALGMRGGPRASLLLRRLVGDYESPVIAEDGSVRLSFDGFDRYWMQVFFRGDFYEPELYRLFARVKRLPDFQLIDGGANIGFWSAVLTSSRFGISRAIAVEASPTTYVELARTADLCGGRFQTVHRALTREEGEVRFAQGFTHASRHIVRDRADVATELISVRSTTIDALVDEYHLEPAHLFVKLDVEGAEMDCVIGGDCAFQGGAVFLYEDHGKDPASRATEALLDHGALCWFIRDDGMLEPIANPRGASQFKKLRTRGYNFLCTSKRFSSGLSLEARLFA